MLYSLSNEPSVFQDDDRSTLYLKPTFNPSEGFAITKVHLQINIIGFVQGLGFRPFVTRLAKHYQQAGWVANTSGGVAIAIEGDMAQQQAFLDCLHTELPALAEIKALSVTTHPLAGFREFQIKKSSADGQPSVFVLPDIATCSECAKDILDIDSRYYQYPFTSCSHCGPRYSIMTRPPYDREQSSMVAFNYCPDCQQEYADIENRRFHAQTIACPACGPSVKLLNGAGKAVAETANIFSTVSDYLRAGNIIALKGIGGFQLLVDATNQQAVIRLRERKQRLHKPFALMFTDIVAAQQLCNVNALEQRALTSPAAPIVLLARRDAESPFPQTQPDSLTLAAAVAPGCHLLGIMLPNSPLHHLLLQHAALPLVVTSGNRENEPICFDNEQALNRLSGIADLFIMHNRPILRPLDDSIVRVINQKLTVLRRARGYAPLPITLHNPLPDMLALGGQSKNTIAISHAQHVILSQHIGDLDSALARQQFQTTLTDLQQFYRCTPTRVMHDLHSGYSSSQFASRHKFPQTLVQHHYAHVLSCMAEHDLEPPALGIAWDGSGLGTDGTLWGGEFLMIHHHGYERFAHFRTFSLPGGYKALLEPRRAALGVLYEMDPVHLGNRQSLHFSPQELNLLRSALNRQFNCPRTSSVGRLFDAVASLLALCQVNHYEGQAAMALEMQATAFGLPYPFNINPAKPMIINWQPVLEQLLNEIPNHSVAYIATRFHATLAEIALAIALKANQKNVVLSGGCFQNACLVEMVVNKLELAGFEVYCHEKIPPNDGGLALGQIVAARYTNP